jgi:hypothetical protein
MHDGASRLRLYECDLLQLRYGHDPGRAHRAVALLAPARSVRVEP